MNETSSACKEKGECINLYDKRACRTEHRLIVEAPIFLTASSASVSFRDIKYLLEGQMNKESLAPSLFLPRRSVAYQNIYAKLKVNSRTQAMSRALEMKYWINSLKRRLDINIIKMALLIAAYVTGAMSHG